MTPCAYRTSGEKFKSSVVSQICNNIGEVRILAIREPTQNEFSVASPFASSYVLGRLFICLRLHEYWCLRCLKGEDTRKVEETLLFMYPYHFSEELELMRRRRKGIATRMVPSSEEYQPGNTCSRNRLCLLFAKKQPTVKKEYARRFTTDKKVFQSEEQKSLHEIAVRVENDVMNLSDADLKSKYGLEEVFSNKVFEVAPRCVWEVVLDGSAEEEDWDKDVKGGLRSYSMLRLSSREVSELVFLAYQLDGPTGAEGYANACKRCPELLRPVDEIQTELGMRLRDALADRIATAQRVVTP